MTEIETTLLPTIILHIGKQGFRKENGVSISLKNDGETIQTSITRKIIIFK